MDEELLGVHAHILGEFNGKKEKMICRGSDYSLCLMSSQPGRSTSSFWGIPQFRANLCM